VLADRESQGKKHTATPASLSGQLTYRCEP
jgi:hypothetical protein